MEGLLAAGWTVGWGFVDFSDVITSIVFIFEKQNLKVTSLVES